LYFAKTTITPSSFQTMLKLNNASFVNLLFMCILFVAPQHVSAQMFTESLDSNSRTFLDDVTLSTGLTFAHFEHTGDLNQGEANFGFDHPMYTLEAQLPSIKLGFKIANGLVGLEDPAARSIYAELGRRLRLAGEGPSFQLLAPVAIRTEFMKVSLDKSPSIFSQSSFQARGGFDIVARSAGSGLSFLIGGGGAFGFSNSQGSIFGGTFQGLYAHSEIRANPKALDAGLFIRITAETSSYEIDGELYDYDLSGWGAMIGVSF
jgi:hypothetical protein